MDYVTRQFINLAKHFRKDLRKALSDLNGALHKQTEAIRESYKAGNDNGCPRPELSVLAKLPEGVEVHKHTKDAKDEKNYKRFMFFVTSLTLGAIVVYADLVYLQYREMVTATKAAAITAKNTQRQLEDFEAQQSARITFENFQATIVPGDTFIVDVKITARNVGPTVADDIAFNDGWGTYNLEQNPNPPWAKGEQPSQPSPSGPSLGQNQTRVFHYRAGTNPHPELAELARKMKPLEIPGFGRLPSPSLDENTPKRAIEDRKIQFFVTPSISYLDIFAQSHVTSDCFTYNPHPSADIEHWVSCPNGHQHN